MDWTGLDWNGLDWTGPEWNALQNFSRARASISTSLSMYGSVYDLATCAYLYGQDTESFRII